MCFRKQYMVCFLEDLEVSGLGTLSLLVSHDAEGGRGLSDC